jgi:CRISPR type III-A-associated RAMP protein Csm4
VTVPVGVNETAVPFFFEWTFFSKEAGLFVIVDAPDELFQELNSLTKELGVNGIGSDRNVGGGHFEIIADEIDIDVPQNANSQILLSLFIPEKEELDLLKLKDSQYSLIQRGGFIAGSSVYEFRHLRRKSVYMFEEGSVFPNFEKLKGKIVNLAPTWNDKRMHKVLRSGKPFTLPIINK